MNEAEFGQTKNAFSITCQVAVNIRAPKERVWDILTNAKEFGRWNSTIERVEGEIGEGNRLRLHVPGTTRVFTPKVSGVVSNTRMTWSDGFGLLFKGVRTFELMSCRDGSTEFRMKERFSGLMLPFVRNLLPDFAPIFSSYAGDLKREAEKNPVNPAVLSQP